MPSDPANAGSVASALPQGVRGGREVGVFATQAAAGGTRAARIAGPNRVEVAARGQAGRAPAEGGAGGVGLGDLPAGTRPQEAAEVVRGGGAGGARREGQGGAR